MRNNVVIGTRGSSLSLCQTEIIRARLEERVPRARFALKVIKAKADQQPDVPLVALGGEGIFVKELEAALMHREIDMAVHSLKDLPLEQSHGVCLAAVTEREDPRDALVSRRSESFDDLPAGSRIGTSSLRRKSQLLHRRRDLKIRDIRGNVDTRVRKLEEGQYDAIVLAACGLIRLGLEGRISEYLSFDWMLPEPGQGALGIEARQDDPDVIDMIQTIDDPTTRACVESERAFLRALGGGCRVPIAAYASCHADTIELEGAVIASDGSTQIRGNTTGSITEPIIVGERLARQLSNQGAKDLLRAAGSRLEKWGQEKWGQT